MTHYLSILKCETHDYWAIAVEREDGGGTRLTPAKCCGSWGTVKRLRMTPAQLREAANELECCAEQEENTP